MNNILKRDQPREHKIKNSWGVFDYFKYYRKIRPKESKYVLTESQYFSIIRNVNKLLIEELLRGNDIKFPHRIGKITITKLIPKIEIIDGKVKTNLPVDWNRTLQLWYDDEECKANKTLVKVQEKEIYRLYYDKVRAIYNNKRFYSFKFNRDLKLRLKHNIKEGIFDAFLINE